MGQPKNNTMDQVEKISEYLKKEYNPLAIVAYGSYMSGTNDAYSDFDCMIITDEKRTSHDDSVINGVQLDCFIFTKEEILNGDIDVFLTVYDGNILLDTDDVAADLKVRVRDYVQEHSKIDSDEKQFIISWMKKTLHRIEKNDDEGNYRALALLGESLTDYFLLRDMFYFGSKKAVSYLKEHDIAGYQLYHNAITDRSNTAIALWVEYVIAI